MTSEVVVSAGNLSITSVSISLDLDANDNPHIAIGGIFGLGNIIYHEKSTSWSSEEVADGSAVDLVLDSNDYAHIAFFGALEGVMYAKKGSSSWSEEHVDAVGTTFLGGQQSIALDSSNNPHIAYYDNYNKDLKYAYD